MGKEGPELKVYGGLRGPYAFFASQDYARKSYGFGFHCQVPPGGPGCFRGGKGVGCNLMAGGRERRPCTASLCARFHNMPRRSGGMPYGELQVQVYAKGAFYGNEQYLDLYPGRHVYIELNVYRLVTFDHQCHHGAGGYIDRSLYDLEVNTSIHMPYNPDSSLDVVKHCGVAALIVRVEPCQHTFQDTFHCQRGSGAKDAFFDGLSNAYGKAETELKYRIESAVADGQHTVGGRPLQVAEVKTAEPDKGEYLYGEGAGEAKVVGEADIQLEIAVGIDIQHKFGNGNRHFAELKLPYGIGEPEVYMVQADGVGYPFVHNLELQAGQRLCFRPAQFDTQAVQVRIVKDRTKGNGIEHGEFCSHQPPAVLGENEVVHFRQRVCLVGGRFKVVFQRSDDIADGFEPAGVAEAHMLADTQVFKVKEFFACPGNLYRFAVHQVPSHFPIFEIRVVGGDFYVHAEEFPLHGKDDPLLVVSLGSFVVRKPHAVQADETEVSL